MYIRRISSVNTKIAFRSLRAQAEETALIDSGATENFIHEETWKQMGIGKQATARPWQSGHRTGFPPITGAGGGENAGKKTQ